MPKKAASAHIYFPGETSYRDLHQAEGLLGNYKLVGYNQMALFVAKGNPKGVKPQLDEIFRKDLNLILGNANSGSVGQETKQMLDKAGIYPRAVAKAALMMPDSRAINLALKRGEGDLTLNWRATAFFADNAPHIEAIDLPTNVAKPQALLLIQLSFSKTRRWPASSSTSSPRRKARRYSANTASSTIARATDHAMTALSRPRGNRALFALLALFLAGFFAIVGVSWLIAGMLDDLERHRGNEQARLFVGEHITTTVRDIEGKFYQLLTASGGARKRLLREIDHGADELQRAIEILEKGGTLTKRLALNIEGYDEMTREMTYRRDPGDSTPALEVIEIAPYLDQLRQEATQLVAALERRDACAERDSLCQGQTLLDIQLHYKTIPSVFFRLNENANRLYLRWATSNCARSKPSRPASAPPCATSRPPSWCWWSAR